MMRHHKVLKCDDSKLFVQEAQIQISDALVLSKEWEDVGECEEVTWCQGTWSTREETKAEMRVMVMIKTIITIAPSKAQNI